MHRVGGYEVPEDLRKGSRVEQSVRELIKWEGRWNELWSLIPGDLSRGYCKWRVDQLEMNKPRP